MKGHLPDERISMWMLGERLPVEEEHVRECRQCTARIAHLEGTLGQFRGAIREWSERTVPAALQQRPRAHWRPARWAVAAVLLLVVGIPVYKVSREARARQAASQADTVLLEQVEAGISRSVPQPMEPLLRLASWDFTANADAEKKDGHENSRQK